MASIALLPDCAGKAVGRFLTFVVTASGGCNLRCSFCLIRQRQEITEDILRPDDLVRFIEEVAERGPVFALAIQGHEPLLPTSLAYTKAVLETGRRLQLPTTLVTNGVWLEDAIDLLQSLAPTKIAISLDSASADTHDRVRGVPGAWVATVRGIARAVEILPPRTSLTVSSVLLPSRRHHLEGMPQRLREIGVDQWIVNPLLRFGPGDVNGPVGDRRSLFRDLLGLQELARHSNIRFTVDDEFDRLGHGSAAAKQPELSSLHVRTLPPEIDVFRLSPSGQTWLGEGILKQAGADVPQWRPDTSHAGDFLETLRRH